MSYWANNRLLGTALREHKVLRGAEIFRQRPRLSLSLSLYERLLKSGKVTLFFLLDMLGKQARTFLKLGT